MQNRKKIIVAIVLGIILAGVIASCVFSIRYQKRGQQGSVDMSMETTSETIAQRESSYTMADFTLGKMEERESIQGEPSTSPAREGVLTDPDGYILPSSAKVAITDTDLSKLSAQEVIYAKNEIYARHGYIFDSDELNRYFRGKNWYVPNENFHKEDIAGIEKNNVDFIADYEVRNSIHYTVQ